MLDNYQGGYGKALIDLSNLLDNYSNALIFHRILRKRDIKVLREFLGSLYDHRHEYLENPDSVSFFWTKDGRLIAKSKMDRDKDKDKENS